MSRSRQVCYHQPEHLEKNVTTKQLLEIAVSLILRSLGEHDTRKRERARKYLKEALSGELAKEWEGPRAQARNWQPHTTRSRLVNDIAAQFGCSRRTVQRYTIRVTVGLRGLSQVVAVVEDDPHPRAEGG